MEPSYHFFASPQCTGDRLEYGKPTKAMCMPSKERILQDVKREMERIGAKMLYVSSDKDYMVGDFYEFFNRTVSNFLNHTAIMCLFRLVSVV